MSQTRRGFPRTRIASAGLPLGVSLVVVFFALALLFPCRAAAAPAATSSEEPSVHQANGPGAQLARETREAAGEDENAEFKHSPAIRFISRITSLSSRAGVLALHDAQFRHHRRCDRVVFQKESSGGIPQPHRFNSAADGGSAPGQRGSESAAVGDRVAAFPAGWGNRAYASHGRNRGRCRRGPHQGCGRGRCAQHRGIGGTGNCRGDQSRAPRTDGVRGRPGGDLAKRQAQVDAATDQALVRKFTQQLASDGAPREGRG